MTRIEHSYHDGSRAELEELAEMLGDCYTVSGRLLNWSLNRFWDWKFGGNAVRCKDDPGFYERGLHIWRSNGRPVAFLISERGADLSFQVHPDHRDLEPEMLEWMEKEWVGDNQVQETSIWETDHWRQRILEEKGWSKQESAGFLRTYDMRLRSPEVPMEEGFHLMTLAEYDSEEGYVRAVKGSFGHETLGMEWHGFKSQAPGFSNDWNILVISPDDRCASFCDVRVDHARSYAEIDPIGTHPDFHRMGLAKACIAESFRRLRESGIRYAYIGSAGEPYPSNRLYDAMWPVEKLEGNIWCKEH
jgi:ribosomal protein S18 acetylase RimI-like enzyme